MGTTFGTPALGSAGAIATPHYLASLAGMDALRDGGSAVDAAIAANMVLGVVWPQMCGIGGDLFAQVWSGGEGQLFGLNASGQAGAEMTLEAYADRGQRGPAMPNRGPLSITVPGAVDGWFTLHQRWGRLEMPRVARDAVRYAREGFRLTSFVAGAIASNADLLAQQGGGADVFLAGGRAPHAGDRLVQPDLARSLETLARQGPGYLYGGELGSTIARFVRQRGSLLTEADFAQGQGCDWVQPLHMPYRGVAVSQLPPNSQGMTLLAMLGMLAETDLPPHGSAALIHHLVECKKLAFADRDAFVADPRCAEVPVDQLLDPAYLHAQAARIGPRAGAPQPGQRPATGDTIFLCAADRDGLVVSLIQSLYAGWGSGVHVPGTGVTLHNRGFGFVLVPGHRNALAPAKRPLHTLMPGLALRDGQPWLAFGTRGADGQPQTGLQLLTGLLDFGLDLQAAIEAPRWAHGAPSERYPRNGLVLEARFGDAVAHDLAERGHDVYVADAVDPVMGTAQMIQLDRDRGCYVAATDPRGDGIALAI